jgi:methylated-DNA-[protein]-cysteine S-methyltransferase
MEPAHIRYEVPGWGVGGLWLAEGRAVWHELPAAKPRVRAQRAEPELGEPAHAELVARLLSYFAGDPVSFDDVELELDGETSFGLALAAALRAVPRGEVVTYGELAALAGRPGAARAAGSFCARNRLPIFIPCHRVVAAGGLGAYGSLGVGYKQRLLELEHAAV